MFGFTFIFVTVFILLKMVPAISATPGGGPPLHGAHGQADMKRGGKQERRLAGGKKELAGIGWFWL